MIETITITVEGDLPQTRKQQLIRVMLRALREEQREHNKRAKARRKKTR